MKIAFAYISDVDNVARGAGYVVSALRLAGNEVRFFDTFNTTIESASAKIISGNFDALMVSTMTMQFPDALRLTRLVKNKTQIPALFGGVHATVMKERILEENPEIDYVCAGEGINAAVAFAETFGTDRLQETPNLIFRDNGQIIANPCETLDNLSELPPFPWNMFSEDSILQKNRSGFTYINATRGCPYNCSFCNNGLYLKLYGRKFLRFRPAQDVIEEMQLLQNKYSPQLFFFSDEMILFDSDYARELLTSVKKQLNAPYGCMARAEHITPEITDIFAKTGCQYVGLGVECGNEEFRYKQLNKKISNSQIETAFSLLRSRKVFTSSFNIIGFPFDYDNQLTRDTIELNRMIRPDSPQVCIFYPFPGTRLYDYCIEKDLIDPEKLKNVKNLREDSVLKNVSLREKREEIEQMLTLGKSPDAVIAQRRYTPKIDKDYSH